MADRAAVIRTPIGATALTFTHLTGRDEISRCFSYTVGFVSSDARIDPLKMLGGVLSIEGEADPKRWFSGLISEFRLTRIEDKIAHYEAVMRPWLWFLGNSTDCRIFQSKTVIEIIEEIFGEYSIARFEKRLQGSYPVREYCVQYDESDLDFVQRLMEHEGIFYFFEHAEGEHTLVLTDAMNKLKPAPGYESVSFHDEGGRQRLDKEYITEWIPGSAVRPGAYAHTDYDFKKPGADLMASSADPFGHKQADGELYRHPGSHLDVGRGDKIAAIRREEAQAPHQRISAAGSVRGLFSGCIFKLKDFPRDDQNQEYLVVSAEYRVFDPRYAAGVEFTGDSFTTVLGVAPTAVTYRPPRITPRPIMRGPQTATVVGPSGEEIYTDEYARVKIQFHWDRLGKKNEESSCFVRVSQTWAGSGWGFIQIPRIGQEVIVDFIEGDPDLPIITGRVYNASQMPPYSLPANATQSGWKSNSSKGGGGWNELRFEDKAGSEEVYFQAQKDHTLLIKNDRNKTVQNDQNDTIGNNATQAVGVNLDETVGNNKTTSVGVNRTVTIGSNDTESVGVDRSLSVGSNETISVGIDSTETIGSNHSQSVGETQTISVGTDRTDSVGASETRSVGTDRTDSVGASETRSVGTDQSISVGASRSLSVGTDETIDIGGNSTETIGSAHAQTVALAQAITVGAAQAITVGGAQNVAVGGARMTEIGLYDSTDVGGIHSLSVGGSSTTDIGGNGTIKVGKKLLIEADDEITLKCGSHSLVMKKDGTITVDGKDISFKASGKINGKASGNIKFKGSNVHNN